MKQTAVEWLSQNIPDLGKYIPFGVSIELHAKFQQAKEMEKKNTDNKVIHFAEWLTKKHPFTLIALYEQFEEQYYSENFKQDETD
jgi:hypothetical protein